jgi:hypothetical protein
MSAAKTRSRLLSYPVGGGTLTEKSVDTLPPYHQDTQVRSEPSTLLHGRQITVSEGHPFSHRLGVNKGDIGGEFYTSKQYMEGATSASAVHESEFKNGIFYDYSYVGSALPLVPTEALFPTHHSFSGNRDDMDEQGATAISRVKPTNSIADLATALGEIRTEGLPHLPGVHSWKTRTHIAKKAGNEFLGVQFGWLPLVGEINNVAHGVTNADRIIAQYVRDSGKLVRRKFDFHPQRITTVTDLGGNHTAILAKDASYLYDPANRGHLIKRVETLIQDKFSGGFTYHLPIGVAGGLESAKSALYAKKVLGLDLSPDTVWNLTPWTWALDWFSNTGDVVSNLSDYATDGLVLRYGYMQRHIVEKHTYSLTGSGLRTDIQVPELTFVTETKMRARANPFGFGLSWDGLTPRQIAISVALGLKRAL